MILSLLIWYFIPPQLCSPHCTTCVYCLKHTCQIKEKLMHLIFNYCPPQPPRTMGKCQSGRSARRHRRALMRARGRQQEFEYWTGIETFPSSAAFSWHISLVGVEGIFFTHDGMCVNVFNHKKVGNCVKYKIVPCLCEKSALMRKLSWLCRFKQLVFYFHII